MINKCVHYLSTLIRMAWRAAARAGTDDKKCVHYLLTSIRIACIYSNVNTDGTQMRLLL